MALRGEFDSIVASRRFRPAAGRDRPTKSNCPQLENSRHLRPGTATFYTQAIDPKVIVKLHLRADAEGNIEFRRRFWTFPGEKPRLTPTLLVYADLLATGDARCLETAQLLRGPLRARLR